MSTAPSGYTPIKKSQTKFGRLMAAFPECAPPGGMGLDGSSAPSPGTVLADRMWERCAQLKSDIADQIMGQGLKPVELKGRLRYVEQVIDNAQKSIATLKPDQMVGAKHPLPELRSAIEARIKELGIAKIDAEKESVRELQAVVARETQAAIKLEGDLRAAATPDGKTTVYKDATKALTEATREHDDWAAQIAEAGGAIDDTQFKGPLDALALVLRRMETVVTECLPKLTTKPGKAPTVVTGGGSSSRSRPAANSRRSRSAIIAGPRPSILTAWCRTR